MPQVPTGASTLRKTRAVPHMLKTRVKYCCFSLRSSTTRPFLLGQRFRKQAFADSLVESDARSKEAPLRMVPGGIVNGGERADGIEAAARPSARDPDLNDDGVVLQLQDEARGRGLSKDDSSKQHRRAGEGLITGGAAPRRDTTLHKRRQFFYSSSGQGRIHD
eukprot:666943-Hanusia_phi.AAC.1